MGKSINTINNSPFKKLGEVCTYSKGKKPVVLKETKTKDCSVPYINIKAFEKGIITEYTNGEKCNICNDDDLLMVWDGARCGLIGKAKKGAVGSTLMKILPKENIHKEYLYHFISSKFWNLNTKPKGVGIPHIEPTLLWNFELVVPSMNEQQAIVAKIEELLSELENGKQQLLTAQQQLKVYRQSLLKWAFEGKLTNKKVKEGELPKGWKRVKVSEIANVVRGGSPRPAGDPKFYDGKIPFLKVRDITKDSGTYLTTFEYTIKEAGLHKTRQIKPNTLLLSNSGATLGVPKICMIDATMNDGIAAFLELDQRSNLFLYYFWVSKTRELRNINMGAAQPNLNTDIIKNYLVPYCSFEEQQLIVDELESKLTVCDKIDETISQSLQQAETLKQSILKQAFEGKLVKAKQ
jgi:type I restriction enzyme S subunit